MRELVEELLRRAAQLCGLPVAQVEDQSEEGYAAVKHPKFELYLDKREEYRFRLKATNGEIILSSESYTQKSGCLNGIESVKKNAPEAEIVEAE